MSFGQLRPIVGGTPVQPHEFPFAMYLSIETQPSWHAVCGGTLISDRHVVTAGHCLVHAPSPQAVKIGYGHTSVKQQEHIRAKRLLVHPQFNPRTLFNDIAVIELERPVRQTASVHRIPVYFGRVEAGQVLTTMGWGITSNAPGARTVAAMNRVDLTIADPRSCRSVDESFVSNDGPFVCTGTQPGGRDECSGDSGSPAVVTMQRGVPAGPRELLRGGLLGRRRRRLAARDVRLVALTSYGDNARHDAHPPCGDPLGFGFSTHVSHYAEFLTNATGLSRSVLEAPVHVDRLVRHW